MVGNPGRGARYNSLVNYVRCLNSEERKANINCMAVVISEDGPIDIEISMPNPKEASDLSGTISLAEEQGENQLGKLMKILLKDKRYTDAERASEDVKHREKLYEEFGIK